MTAGVATKKQANYLAKHLSNPDTFGGIVPFVSLSRNDSDEPYTLKINGEEYNISVGINEFVLQ